MPMLLSLVGGLANAAIALGSKGHDAGDLLDFQLLARPAKALPHHTQGGHGRAARTAQIHPAGPATSAAAPAPGAARSAASGGRVLAGWRRIELGLDQTL